MGRGTTMGFSPYGKPGNFGCGKSAEDVKVHN